MRILSRTFFYLDSFIIGPVGANGRSGAPECQLRGTMGKEYSIPT